MNKVIAVSLVLLLNLASSGQTLNVAKLDSFINALSARELALGSLTISINGKVQYQKALGYSYIDGNKKIKTDINTKYRIGSVSKMFTAIMILQLAEEGKISLGQKLSTFYPGLPNSDKITIRQMLYHRSGLHDYTQETDFRKWMDQPKTHAELLNIIQAKGTNFEPDTRAEYSSSNYLLLGYIIERVCKMSYEDALEKRITSVIGLRDTYYAKPIAAERNESASYKFSDSSWKVEKETHPGIHGGAGSIVSTPTDLVKLMDSFVAYKLVNQKSVALMNTLIDEYGMGLFAGKYGSKASFGHNGRIEEFYSALWFYPQERLTIAYCTNGINYPRADIIEGVVKICFKEPFDLPFSKTEISEYRIPDTFLGRYDSKQLSVTCKKNKTDLEVEARGKIFKLQPITENYFMNTSSGYYFQFFPDKGELQIKETDNVYYLKKESK